MAIRINGQDTTLAAPPHATLADALHDAGLTGLHLGCEHGVCGACTVLLDGEPVRSCIVLAAQAEGHEVRTIEGLAPDADTLHPVQQAFSEHHALQCGFCTPGFEMLAVGILEREPGATPERIRELLSANLCRCTGYKPILAAVLSAQQVMAAQ
ncbi:MAG TPA: (2Fe-2S)-binding protein [Gaiellaceae bacterium]|nr:(2Fe-2S)-binding protein [Gaiellaceae bacterium]